MKTIIILPNSKAFKFVSYFMQELSKKCGSLRKMRSKILDTLLYTSIDCMDSYHLKYLIDIHVHLATGNNYNYHL